MKEQNYGVYEAMPYDYLPTNIMPNGKKQFGCRLEKGEPLFRVIQRIYNLLDEIKEKYPDENVLLVAHGGICKTVNSYFNEVSNEDYFNYNANNCEISEYSF